MARKIQKSSHNKVKRLHDEGFSITELAIMYNTSNYYVEMVLDNEDTR